MTYLVKTSSRILGEQLDFERESYLEGFISSNPLVLASSEDAPEDLVPVYIIGRQELCKMEGGKHGITDLTCLIWNPNLGKAGRYEIWIYELKVYSNSLENVNQLTEYLNAIESSEHSSRREELVNRAAAMVGEDLIDRGAKIRGALCAQSFSDEVMKKIIEENAGHDPTARLVAVRINRFPVENDVFVLVEPFIGEEKEGKRKTYYDDDPQLPEEELKRELIKLLEKRKTTHPERFEQLKVLLEMLASSPGRVVTQNELRAEWQNKGLPGTDRGLSVSQFLGYKNSGALRQLVTWKIVAADIKDYYRLKNERDVEVIREVLADLSKI